jgi:hypothetical protein
MRESEAGNGPQQHASVAHDQDERAHEQQVIEAKQDMLDTVHEIGHVASQVCECLTPAP